MINFVKTLEDRRTELVKTDKLDEFLRTYSGEIPEIKDKNTGTLWDTLNRKSSFDKSENPMAFYRIKVVEEMIPDNIKVLDTGFGSGILEERLNKSNKKIDLSGIDISKLSVEYAKKEFKNYSFKVGSILKIPFEDNSFDCVLALEVLEHIKPSYLFQALGEVSRVLKDKGYFIVSVPLNEGLPELLKEGKNPNAHLRAYTPEIICAELEIAKFKILRKEILFAFHKNYLSKSFIAKYIIPGVRKPNNIIILAQKK